MEPKWTIVKRKTSKASRQGQNTSLVQSATAKEVKEEMREEEMWREEDFDKPDFLFKVPPKLTRSEKKKKRQMRLKNLTEPFNLNLEEFPPLVNKVVKPEDEDFKELKVMASKEDPKSEVRRTEDLKVIASQEDFESEVRRVKKSIKKEKQRLKKAITKRLQNYRKPEIVSFKNKKPEIVSFNLEEITRFLRAKLDESSVPTETESGLYGGAPLHPKKISPVVPSLEEQIKSLEIKIKNVKGFERRDDFRRNTLLKKDIERLIQ